MNCFEENEQIRFSEERVIHRISMSRFLTSAIDAFNLDRGLIYTLKRLFTTPGDLIRDYLCQSRDYSHGFHRPVCGI